MVLHFLQIFVNFLNFSCKITFYRVEKHLSCNVDLGCLVEHFSEKIEIDGQKPKLCQKLIF